MAEMAAPAGATDKKLYARKSSGLVRTIGIFGAMVFGVHCISLSSSGLIPFSWVAGVWPGSSIIGVLTVAMFFCLFHAYTYSVIGATMPRSAADYTLASRTLSAPLAFAASWTLVIFSAMVAGSLIAWIPKTAFPVLFHTMGIVMNNPGIHQLRQLVFDPARDRADQHDLHHHHLRADDPAHPHDPAHPGSGFLPGPAGLGRAVLPTGFGCQGFLPGRLGQVHGRGQLRRPASSLPRTTAW